MYCIPYSYSLEIWTFGWSFFSHFLVGWHSCFGRAQGSSIHWVLPSWSSNSVAFEIYKLNIKWLVYLLIFLQSLLHTCLALHVDFEPYDAKFSCPHKLFFSGSPEDFFFFKFLNWNDSTKTSFRIDLSRSIF